MQFYPSLFDSFRLLSSKSQHTSATLNLYKWRLSAATPHLPDLKHLSSAFPYQQSIRLLFVHCTNINHVIIRPSANIIIFPLIQISFRSCVFYQECASSSNCVHKGQTNGQFASSQLIVTPAEGEESEC